MEPGIYPDHNNNDEEAQKKFADRAQNTIMENFTFAGNIGQGKIGQVFKVINQVTKNQFALKTIEMPNRQLL